MLNPKRILERLDAAIEPDPFFERNHIEVKVVADNEIPGNPQVSVSCKINGWTIRYGLDPLVEQCNEDVLVALFLAQYEEVCKPNQTDGSKEIAKRAILGLDCSACHRALEVV